VARVELSAEARAIESLIDTGQKELATARLRAATFSHGRRPEYRYLLSLHDARFRLRPDADLLKEVNDLVSDQPELVEATALLAELYARAGDEERAGLFARMALDSNNPSARARAIEVLAAHGHESIPPASMPLSDALEAEARAAGAPHGSADIASDVATARQDPASIRAWFERARHALSENRSGRYGVRGFESVNETLLDWGRAVSEGSTFLGREPLPLTRESLGIVDDVILSMRRQFGRRATSQSDTSRTMAVAGFFLAVALHELDATVVAISPADGGCKVLLESGAGARPLLVAAACLDGTGPSLMQTFDRLSAVREIATAAPPPSQSMRRLSSGRLPVVRTVSSKPSVPAAAARHDLSVTRLEAESATVRRLDRPTWPADPPPLELSGVASMLAQSALGQEIAGRTGTLLAPTPASIEALESYCTATRGESGSAVVDPAWQPSDEEEEWIVAWGALLGETLIYSYGGVWECDPAAPSDPRLFRVICQDRVAAWPMTQVYLRLRAGSAQSMIGFLASVDRLLSYDA
jgi:hypothetical protein